MILESATTKSKRHAEKPKESVGYIDMASSTLYVCPYSSENDSEQDLVMDFKKMEMSFNAILRVIREIYHGNGFSNIQVMGITRKEAEGLNIKSQDTIVTILGGDRFGFSAGLTPDKMNNFGKSKINFKPYILPESTSYSDLDMSYVATRIYKDRNKDKVLTLDINLLIGYAIAHESLHQLLMKVEYLMKAEIGLDSENHFDHFPNSNTLFPNLSMDYRYAKYYLAGKQKVDVEKTAPGIFNIYHKAELRTYFGMINNGVNSNGSSLLGKLACQVKLFHEFIKLSEEYKTR